MKSFDKNGPTSELKDELIEFTQNLVSLKSLSGQEKEIVKFVKRKRIALGYDKVSNER
jgi:acetylornithine deacetylase/succinyl-diaminopimelate desuccinylase-like protein